MFLGLQILIPMKKETTRRISPMFWIWDIMDLRRRRRKTIVTVSMTMIATMKIIPTVTTDMMIMTTMFTSMLKVFVIRVATLMVMMIMTTIYTTKSCNIIHRVVCHPVWLCVIFRSGRDL